MGIDIAVAGKPGHIAVTGIDKHQDRQYAAATRSLPAPAADTGQGIQKPADTMPTK